MKFVFLGIIALALTTWATLPQEGVASFNYCTLAKADPVVESVKTTTVYKVERRKPFRNTLKAALKGTLKVGKGTLKVGKGVGSRVVVGRK